MPSQASREATSSKATPRPATSTCLARTRQAPSMARTRPGIPTSSHKGAGGNRIVLKDCVLCLHWSIGGDVVLLMNGVMLKDGVMRQHWVYRWRYRYRLCLGVNEMYEYSNFNLFSERLENNHSVRKTQNIFFYLVSNVL